MGEWFSQWSAKPYTLVRFQQEPQMNINTQVGEWFKPTVSKTVIAFAIVCSNRTLCALLDMWQTWCMHRTENPTKGIRFSPCPHNNGQLV